MKTCPTCQTKIQDKDHLCMYCGAIFNSFNESSIHNYDVISNTVFMSLQKFSLYEGIKLKDIYYDYIVKLSDYEFVGLSKGVLKSNLANQKNIKVSKRLKYDGAIIHTHEALELNKKQADYFIDNDVEIDFYGQDLASYLYDLKEELAEELLDKYRLEEIDDEKIIYFETLYELVGPEFDFDEVPSKIQTENQQLDSKVIIGLQLFFDNVIPTIIDNVNLDEGFKLTTIQEKFKELSLKREAYHLLKTNKYNYSTTFEIVLRIETIEGFDISQYFLNTKFIESSDIDIYHEDNWWYEEPHLYESVLEIYFDQDVVEEVSSISG